MSHYWGDDWEHWDELYTAIDYFNKIYQRVAGKRPITKEKYGSIRFEFVSSWLKSESDAKAFKHIIRKIVTKFPNVRAEICHDAGLILDDEFFNGWCAGIAYISDGSYWRSNDRPKGV